MHPWKALFQAGIALHGRGCCEGLLARSKCWPIRENHDLGSFRPSCEKWEIKKKPLWCFGFFSLLCLGYRRGTSHRSLMLSPSVHVPLPLGTHCPSCHTSKHRQRFGCLSSCSVSFFTWCIPSGSAGRSNPLAGTSLGGSRPSQRRGAACLSCLPLAACCFLQQSAGASLCRRAPISLRDA